MCPTDPFMLGCPCYSLSLKHHRGTALTFLMLGTDLHTFSHIFLNSPSTLKAGITTIPQVRRGRCCDIKQHTQAAELVGGKTRTLNV